VTALLAADAYFWHGMYLSMGIQFVRDFGREIDYHVARILHF